jgi:hypothetical protein
VRANRTIIKYFVYWVPETDTFSIGITKPEEIIYTKKGILSVAASLYDPIGMDITCGDEI